METTPLPQTISTQLKQLAADHNLKDRFETQRKNIGRAYALANEIREASKDGIASLKLQDSDNVQACIKDMQSRWTDLIQLDLPKDIAWQHESEAGQEMVELILVQLFYSVLLGTAKLESIQMPSHQDLMVTPQTWLAGIGDLVGEIGKLTDDLLCTTNMTREERKTLRIRFVEIGEQIYDFLERFEIVYAQVINNSRRKGYGNTYRGLLGRVRGAINRQKSALIDTYDREVAN